MSVQILVNCIMSFSSHYDLYYVVINCHCQLDRGVRINMEASFYVLSIEMFQENLTEHSRPNLDQGDTFKWISEPWLINTQREVVVQPAIGSYLFLSLNKVILPPRNLRARLCLRVLSFIDIIFHALGLKACTTGDRGMQCQVYMAN